MDLWSIQIPATVSLAVVAALGYFVGRRANADKSQVTARSKHDLHKARSVARELERIASMLRKGLARHHSRLSKFRQRVSQLDAATSPALDQNSFLTSEALHLLCVFQELLHLLLRRLPEKVSKSLHILQRLHQVLF